MEVITRVLLLCFLFNSVCGGSITHDMRTLTPVEYTWLEIGFTHLDGENWVKITSSTAGFRDPVVFLSVPTSTAFDSAVWAPRTKNVQLTQDGHVTMDTKIYQPNKSDCVNPFYEPSVDFSSKVIWMIADRGAYEVAGNLIIAWSGDITRPNVLPSSSSNLIRIYYPGGCPTLRNGNCTFPENTTVGVISQLQTLTHDRFLQVRASFVARSFARFYLTPHDSSDPNFAVITEPETLAFLSFPVGAYFRCGDGVALEGRQLNEMTAVPVKVTFLQEYDGSPGVFGMVSSVFGLDPVGIRTYAPTPYGTNVKMQEDICADNETQHDNLERVSLFVIGEALDTDVNPATGTCNIVYNYTVTDVPTVSPSAVPTSIPSPSPTRQPTSMPTRLPTVMPSRFPTFKPTSKPTIVPTNKPSVTPTKMPTTTPTVGPTSIPTVLPTIAPTDLPSVSPTYLPTAEPTENPTSVPTVVPTKPPTRSPTATPTYLPTSHPSEIPSHVPSVEPTYSPTDGPTYLPTFAPTLAPTLIPTDVPTVLPTDSPTSAPTADPTHHPTASPSQTPTVAPTSAPTSVPTVVPTGNPTSAPAADPTLLPTAPPSQTPTVAPTSAPTSVPTVLPTDSPTSAPTADPTHHPTASPSQTPTVAPTSAPTSVPTVVPTGNPTSAPAADPTHLPTAPPSQTPTVAPTSAPTSVPTVVPTGSPSSAPTAGESNLPTPIGSPTSTPTFAPTYGPIGNPSTAPTVNPTHILTASPTRSPTLSLSIEPSGQPTYLPGHAPTASSPSGLPTIKPTSRPGQVPTTSSPTAMGTPVPSVEPAVAPTLRNLTGDALAICSLMESTNLPQIAANRGFQGWRCSSMDSIAQICSNWTRVTCVSGRVQAIDMSGLGMMGTIYDEFGALDCLTYLNLSHNEISGPLPPALIGLLKLDTFDISDNKLGVASAAVTINGTRDMTAHLRKRVLDRQLAAALSDASILSSLPALTWLDISSNGYTGPIPTSLCSIPLETLILSTEDTEDNFPPNQFSCIPLCLRSINNLVGGHELSLCPQEEPTSSPTGAFSALKSSSAPLKASSLYVYILPAVIFICCICCCIGCYCVYGANEDKEDKDGVGCNDMSTGGEENLSLDIEEVILAAGTHCVDDRNSGEWDKSINLDDKMEKVGEHDTQVERRYKLHRKFNRSGSNVGNESLPESLSVVSANGDTGAVASTDSYDVIEYLTTMKASDTYSYSSSYDTSLGIATSVTQHPSSVVTRRRSAGDLVYRLPPHVDHCCLKRSASFPSVYRELSTRSEVVSGHNDDLPALTLRKNITVTSQKEVSPGGRSSSTQEEHRYRTSFFNKSLSAPLEMVSLSRSKGLKPRVLHPHEVDTERSYSSSDDEPMMFESAIFSSSHDIKSGEEYLYDAATSGCHTPHDERKVNILMSPRSAPPSFYHRSHSLFAGNDDNQIPLQLRKDRTVNLHWNKSKNVNGVRSEDKRCATRASLFPTPTTSSLQALSQSLHKKQNGRPSLDIVSLSRARGPKPRVLSREEVDPDKTLLSSSDDEASVGVVLTNDSSGDDNLFSAPLFGDDGSAGRISEVSESGSVVLA